MKLLRGVIEAIGVYVKWDAEVETAQRRRRRRQRTETSRPDQIALDSAATQAARSQSNQKPKGDA